MAPFEYAPAPLSDDLRRTYARYGCQSDLTFAALMTRNRQEFGGLPAVLEGDNELTWRELMDAAGRFGGWLAGRGIGSGDVVTWQLPNWWEAVVVAYGIWAAGAVSNPVVPIYRGLELRQIVEAVQPRCVVTAASSAAATTSTSWPRCAGTSAGRPTSGWSCRGAPPAGPASRTPPAAGPTSSSASSRTTPP